ncbi:MAG: signal peptidase I [Oscillospiraceae bacterium]|nr:signal peptidase I [Oscillospiraceae bacterium]
MNEQIEQTKQTEGAGGKPEQETPKSVGYQLHTLLHDLVYILACVTILFVFAIRLVGVDGDSMYPTLHHTDYLGLLSNVFYRDVEPGDVVVLAVPFFEDKPIVKRVVAAGGQTVDIDFERGIVYVDGEALDEPYINEPTYLSYAESGQALTYPVTVPEGCLFVMGDNRNHSADSRFAPVGLVAERDVLGKVLWILVPGADPESSYPDARSRDFSRIGGVS